MLNELKKQARFLKISDLGVVRARVFKDLCLDLSEKNTSEFVHESIEERCNPFLIMPEAKSLVVCIFSYNIPQAGEISKYAMGKDYHIVAKEKLKSLAETLTKKGYRAMCFADSWGMNERYLAVSAGLGFIGKNHMFISHKWGSFVFIGVIVTDCEIEESKKLNLKCADCGECIKNCPGNAILDDGNFLEKNCVSFISQKKGDLDEKEKNALLKSKMIWGCDICQNVCPHNKNVPFTQIEEFYENVIENLEFEKDMSNKEFKKLYKDHAFSWRGLAPLLRNKNILNEYKNKK